MSEVILNGELKSLLCLCRLKTSKDDGCLDLWKAILSRGRRVVLSYVSNQESYFEAGTPRGLLT